MNYQEFLESKKHSQKPSSSELLWSNPSLFGFQEHLVKIAFAESRFAIFADVGLGKTIMQLTWAKNVAIATSKPVLILAPLAVTYQTAREAEKFNIEGVAVSRDGTIQSEVVITNYEQLGKFNPVDFGGVCCDESSILKSFDGQTRTLIIDFMRKIDYRLLCSATPAPNDFIELGSSSEALGVMGSVNMLQRFFRNYRDNCTTKRHFGEAPKWQFRGHAEIPFWQWVSTWSRAVKSPSDLGFDNVGYTLPGLEINYHKVEVKPPEGMLFPLPCVTLAEQRQEVRRTINDRCERSAELIRQHSDPFIVWCNLNDESKLLKELIPDAVEISGSDSDDSKLKKFQSFLSGDSRGLITKPKIGAWGLNFQHCSNMIYFPNHSYEQWYQCVGRCYRYGQKKTVSVDVVYSPGEQRIIDNMNQKADKAKQMYSQLVAQMNNPFHIQKTNTATAQEIPSWLK